MKQPILKATLRNRKPLVLPLLRPRCLEVAADPSYFSKTDACPGPTYVLVFCLCSQYPTPNSSYCREKCWEKGRPAGFLGCLPFCMFDYCHLVAIWHKLNSHPIPQMLLYPCFLRREKSSTFQPQKGPKNCCQRLPGASVFSGNYLNACQLVEV